MTTTPTIDVAVYARMASGAYNRAGPDNEGDSPDFTVLLRALAYNDAFETVAKEGAYTEYN